MNRNYRNFDDRRMRGGRDMNNRNYNNFNRSQGGRMNQSMSYEYRRRGMYQRNNETYMRDRYAQRQRFSKDRPSQDYSGTSYKSGEESRQYESRDSARSDQSSHQIDTAREKPKSITEEESSSRPSEENVQLKKRARSSSTSSSSSSESSTDTDDSSSTDSSSSSEDEKKRKKRKKMAKKLKKAEKKRKKKKLKKKLKKMKTRKDKPVKEKKKNNNPKEKTTEEGSAEAVDKSKAMAPMTKEQWEKRQNVVRKVYDKDSGRHR